MGDGNRQGQDNQRARRGGAALGSTGDPFSMVAGAIMRRRGTGAPDAKYDANIATGGPFKEQEYTGPSMQAGSGGPTAAMEVTRRGSAENYWQNQKGRVMGPSLSEQAADGATQRLSGPTASQQYQDATSSAIGRAGTGEQWFSQNQGRFQEPTASQQEFGQMGAQGATALDQVRGQMGDMPSFDAFYDRARERQAGGINDQLAARGQFGSSAGLDQLSQGMTDLNAAQANREADFAMSRAQQGLDAASQSDALNMQGAGLRMQGAGQADQYGQSLLGMGMQGSNQAQQQQLARLGLGGTLAGQADQANIGQEQALADILQGADASGMNRYTAGLQGSQGAQAARQGRIGQAFGAQMGAQNAFLNTLGPSLNNMIGADQNLLNTAMGAEAGLSETLANNSRADLAYQAQQQQQRINNGLQGLNTAASAASVLQPT